MHRIFAGLLLGLAALASQVEAQQGHPLTGTWQGEWGPAEAPQFLTLILEWDGKSLSGIANPGPEVSEIRKAELDSSDWSVHVEVEVRGPDGKPELLVAEGQLQDIGSYNRRIEGSWRFGGDSGPLSISRQ